MTDRPGRREAGLCVGVYEEHNAGIAAVENGEVRLYLEFERETRVKNQAGWFPDKVARVLDGLGIGEVRAICTPRPAAMQRLLVDAFGASPEPPHAVRLDGRRIEIYGQDDLHPSLHLLSMLVLPGLRPGVYAVLIFDAEQPRMGWLDLREPLAGAPAVTLDRISDRTWFNGELFADFFGKLFYGSRDLSHCGKLMGLASWGRVRLGHVELLARLAEQSFDAGGLVWQGYDGTRAEDLHRAVGEALGADPLRHDCAAVLDLAASAQELFCHEVTRQAAGGLARLMEEMRGRGLPAPEALLYSGGCALSVVSNQEIRRATGLPLIAAPYAHDASQFLGAAVWASLQEGGGFPLGRGWPGLPVHTEGRVAPGALAAVAGVAGGDGGAVPATPAEVARRLAAGQLIALVRDGAEAGPRALGNRSLLANALDPGVRDRINFEVKKREWYRPFAPALPREAFGDYFAEPATACARYMLDAFRVRPGLRSLLSSVTSPDGTSRPQAVERGLSPWYYDLLQEMGRLTGHPVVLNTSLNAPGLPIALDLRQALDDAVALGVDALVADGALVPGAALPAAAERMARMAGTAGTGPVERTAPVGRSERIPA
jgi:carbamoyltransferase